ncbi:hypothetical protein [Cellulomonas chengniuliangii]|uniref:Uncharacterized protein n=1 Tax=Cellulomonas chengniuliangii TaxID=2968084 RepID=A0ABY5L3T9_9CELL|nr:hypothetical protein [Cellulomonas chengniuliangii]MCC2307082.1 hypothetical protein [Cellulomonas chengniuliangii]UUI76120.1 hypothetical protein NP064_04220 [Cellulomonas chengniuliangii]
MNVPAVLVLAVTPSPSPTSEVAGSQAGSPGILGFIVTFAVALAAIGLFFGLTRQLRRMEHRAEQMGLEGRRRVDGPWPGAEAPDAPPQGPGAAPGAPGGPGDGPDGPGAPRP